MIVDIDHIALSSLIFAKDIHFWEKLGYVQSFAGENVRNSAIKEEFLSNYSSSHHLSFLTNGGNFNIELLNHGTISRNESFICPVFDNFPFETQGTIDNFLPFAKAVFGDDNLPAYFNYKPESLEFGFNKLVFKTDNILSSCQFWENFGFSQVETHKDYIRLEFKSLLKGTVFTAFLIEQRNVFGRYCLDYTGFNCIAFITNSAKRERASLQKRRVAVTEVDSIELNKKELDIFFATGPSGEIVEIIGIKGD